MVERICALTREDMHDDEIAHILTQEGHHSPWEADKVLPVTVQLIRLTRRGRPPKDGGANHADG
jgi:hypothetical protein